MTLTVAVCTGGRDSIVHTIRSLSKQSRPADKLLIVDQSGVGKARKAVEETEYPFAYEVVDQDVKGLSKARNEVVRKLETDWVFFTDDDCVVSLDLVDQFHMVINRYPEAAFLGGTCIRPLYYDPITDDAPGHCISRQVELNAQTIMVDEDVMGACLAFRKEVFDKVGRFDPYIGAGAEWSTGEECDFVFRAISKGFTGRATARLVVFHEYGARKRPPDGTENSQIGNTVVMWKMRQMGCESGMKMAQRIYPAGRKKLLLSRLTLGKLFPGEPKIMKRCKLLEARLDREFEVVDGILNPKKSSVSR